MKPKYPFGYRWSIATHKEDLASAEIEKRGAAAFAAMAKKAPAPEDGAA